MAQPEVQNGVGAAPAVVFTAAKPHLMVEAPKASDAVAFYKAAFCAEELDRSFHPKRKADQETPLVLSAQIVVAGTTILVSDNADASAAAALNAEGIKANKCVVSLETEEVDLAVAKAVKAGAILEGEVAETDGGVRAGKVVDPFGFTWIISAPAKKCAEVEEA